jgi:hypothetical protein
VTGRPRGQAWSWGRCPHPRLSLSTGPARRPRDRRGGRLGA